MNRKLTLWTVAAMLSVPATMMAQYPQLTPEAKDFYQKMITSAREHADSAWAVAKPVVEKEAREGRPYVPWASRPDDLVKAPSPPSPELKAAACTPPADAAAR